MVSRKQMSKKIVHFLDITEEVCPMTFVKTRLLIEKMKPGETAEIRMAGKEPLENVPASIKELGHKVLCMKQEVLQKHLDPNAIHLLHLQKC